MSYRDINNSSAINMPGRILIALAGIIAGFLLCRIFIIPFHVQDSTMEPSIKKGARVLVFRFATPSPGDIVLAENPSDDGRVILSRVIAGENSTVEIRNRILYINNRKDGNNINTRSTDSRNLPLHFTNRDTMTPVRLEKDQYFLMGDNRDRSYDSRQLGPFSPDMIKGRVFYTF